MRKITNLALFDEKLVAKYLENDIETETPLYFISESEILILPAIWQDQWMEAPYWNGESWICAVCQEVTVDNPSFLKIFTTLSGAKFFSVNAWIHGKCGKKKQLNDENFWTGYTDPSGIEYTRIRNGNDTVDKTPDNPDFNKKLMEVLQ